VYGSRIGSWDAPESPFRAAKLADAFAPAKAGAIYMDPGAWAAHAERDF